MSFSSTISLRNILLACFFIVLFNLTYTPYAHAQSNTTPQATVPTSGREDGNRVNVPAELGFTTAAKYVYDGLTGIGSWFTYVGGFLLDISLSWFVWGMADTVKDFKLEEVIKTVWALVRDLFNLLFIFGLIYIGFNLILGRDEGASKRNLGTLIVAALLINFSLYFVQVVVDFGNVVSIEMANQFGVESRSTVMDRPVFNIADSFVEATDLNNLSSSTLTSIGSLSSGIENPPGDKIGMAEALVIGLTVALMLIVLGFVFAAGAILMMIRFFYLIFFMMFAPVLVLGMVLPQFKSISSEFVDKLIKQTLIGPAFLFTLYISMLALQAFADDPRDQNITTFLLMSLVVSGFAWASLMAAQKIGAVGASQAVGLGRSMAKSVRGGVTGFAGRNTIGRFADNYNRRLEERGVSDKSWRRSIAASVAGNKFGSSYSRVDAKSSSEKATQKRARFEAIYGKQTGRLSAIGIGTRAGGISGAIAQGKDSAKGSKERIDMEKAITGASNEQLLEILGKYKKGTPEYDRTVEHMSASQYESVMKAKAEELDDNAKEELAGVRKSYIKRTVDANGGISKASESQLKVLGATEIADNAGKLRQSQFEDIMKSKDYTETEKDNIRTKRESQLADDFSSDPVTFFNNRKDTEVAKLPADKILKTKEAAPHLTSSHLKKMMHEDTLTKNDRADIRTNVKANGNKEAQKWLLTSEGRLF